MTNRNWDAARRRDAARRTDVVPGPFALSPPVEPDAPARDPFPILYARYAGAERRAGRKPLPPAQWLRSTSGVKH